MTNVIQHPANQPHWEGPVRCMLCGAEHRAAAPVIEWAEGCQPVDCGTCKGVRSCIEVDTAPDDWAAVMAMTPDDIDADLRRAGIDPVESAARGRALVAKLSAEHKARATREHSPRDMADYELEQIDVMIRDCWQKLYGTREFPKPLDRRRALGRIRDIIVTCVDPIASEIKALSDAVSPPKPPRRLPLGVVRDDGESN